MKIDLCKLFRDILDLSLIHFQMNFNGSYVTNCVLDLKHSSYFFSKPLKFGLFYSECPLLKFIRLMIAEKQFRLKRSN